MPMNLKHIPFLLLAVCAALSLSAQEVRHAGAMHNVKSGMSLAPQLRWDTLNPEYLNGVGPLGRLEGEVTVLEGNIYVAAVDADGNLVTDLATRAASPFGVYARAGMFLSTRIARPVNNLQGLEQLIAEHAAQLGWDMEQPFLFRVEGVFEQVKLHVMAKPAGEIGHNPELHEKAKRHFSYQDISGTLVGFYSKKHEGVFTHKGQFIHVHFIDDEKNVMGHLDDIVFREEIVVLFPLSE
jgi:acetolactate decarboxylase